MTIHTKQEKDLEYGQSVAFNDQRMVLNMIDAEINSLLIRLGQMGYTKDAIVERLRTLYDNPTVADGHTC